MEAPRREPQAGESAQPRKQKVEYRRDLLVDFGNSIYEASLQDYFKTKFILKREPYLVLGLISDLLKKFSSETISVDSEITSKKAELDQVIHGSNFLDLNGYDKKCDLIISQYLKNNNNDVEGVLKIKQCCLANKPFLITVWSEFPKSIRSLRNIDKEAKLLPGVQNTRDLSQVLNTSLDKLLPIDGIDKNFPFNIENCNKNIESIKSITRKLYFFEVYSELSSQASAEGSSNSEKKAIIEGNVFQKLQAKVERQRLGEHTMYCAMYDTLTKRTFYGASSNGDYRIQGNIPDAIWEQIPEAVDESTYKFGKACAEVDCLRKIIEAHERKKLQDPIFKGFIESYKNSSTPIIYSVAYCPGQKRYRFPCSGCRTWLKIAKIQAPFP